MVLAGKQSTADERVEARACITSVHKDPLAGLARLVPLDRNAMGRVLRRNPSQLGRNAGRTSLSRMRQMPAIA